MRPSEYGNSDPWIADTPEYEFRVRDIKNTTGIYSRLKIELPAFNESTDRSANYAFKIGWVGSAYYTSISQGKLNESMYDKSWQHKILVIKRINRVTLNVLNYNWTPRYRYNHILEKIPSKIKAKIKKNGVVLEEIELTNNRSVLYGLPNINAEHLQYVGFIDENKVPLTETDEYGNENFATYELEVEPPDGYIIPTGNEHTQTN